MSEADLGGPGDLGHQPGRPRLLQGGEHVVFAQIGHPADHADLELGSDDGRRRQDAVGIFGQPGQASPDHLPHPFGDAELVDRRRGRPPALPMGQASCLRQVPQHLTHEERIAFRLAVDGPHETVLFVGQLVAGGRLHVFRHAIFVEAVQ